MLEPQGDLEALLAEAHRRVEQRALEREAAAARRAREILQGADEDAAATTEERLERTRFAAAELRKRVLARGAMAAQRVMLERREALLDEVWRVARERLAALPRDAGAYLASLRALAQLASRALAASDVELATEEHGRALLTPRRLADWGEQDGVRYRLAAEPLAAVGGLEARAGRLRFDGSFETRLQQGCVALREAIAARLGAGAPSSAASGDEGGAG